MNKILFFLVLGMSCLCYGQSTWREILINGTTQQKINILKKIIAEKNTRVLTDVPLVLDDPSVEVRILASEALLKLGDNSFLTSYQKQLNDSHWQVRLNGIKAIVLYGTADEVLFDIKKALDDSYWQIRYWAATGIGKFGDENMIDPIISHLSDENLKVRAELFWALRRILGRDQARYAFKKLPDSSIVKISQALKVDDLQTQINAIWALEATSDIRVVPILLGFLNSPLDDVKIQSLWALENLKANEGFEFLRAKLLEPSTKLKIEAIKTLVRLDDSESIPALIGKLEDEDENVRIFALWALKKFEDSVSFPAIVKKLADKSEKVRNYAYTIILTSKKADFIPVLEDVIVDNKFPIGARITAVELLGKIGTKEESLFFDSIKNHSEPGLRKAILSAWFNINSKDSAFLSYLNFASRLESNQDVRSNARNILKKVMTDVKRGLLEKEEDKRNEALGYLSFFKDNNFITPLIREMLSSKYQDVQRAGLELIQYQPEAAIFPILKEIITSEDSIEMKKLAIIGLGKARITKAIPILLSQLRSENPEIQLCAAYSLAMMGNNSGLKIALRDLQSQDYQTQAMAAETIGILGNPVAIASLLRILEGSELEVKLKVAWALARMGEEKGLYTIVNLSRQDIEPLRTQARYYLIDKKIPLSLRARIPEIQKKLEEALKGMPEAQLKKIIATKINQPPVVDGDQNDRIWRAAVEDRTMVYVSGEKVLSEVQTSVAVAFDQEKIYFLFICNDPQASSLTFDSRDFITICINPALSDRRWHQYTLHATNFLKYAYVWKKYELDDADAQWKSGWVTATSLKDKFWIAEIAIPFSDFGLSGPPIGRWEINFQRVSDHLPAVTWTGKIDNPAQFGQIVFKTTGR
ncbi:MAG: HEAT repeat domain-containing protein [Candidatus Omnitrophica bacterium]|nr:HEAT repeat domain-containing protein [Candidatus Omnitrophota bacterium]